MAKKESSNKRVPQPDAEINPNPESEKESRDREAIAEREKLLDLARCFVQAAVTRLLEELRPDIVNAYLKVLSSAASRR
jgi:hypothetical protein